MKIRFGLLLISFFSLPSLAQSADRSAIVADRAAVASAAAERSAALQAAGRGATLTSNSQEYQILPRVRAAESRPQDTQQQAVTRAGGSQLIESKGNFVVYVASTQGTASITQVNGVTTYPTVLNTRTGGIGILLDTLNVKLKDITTAAAVASDLGLEQVRQFAHLQIVFYRVKSGQDVVAAAASLAGDSRVVSAEVEVLEHMNVPN